MQYYNLEVVLSKYEYWTVPQRYQSFRNLHEEVSVPSI